MILRGPVCDSVSCGTVAESVCVRYPGQRCMGKRKDDTQSANPAYLEQQRTLRATWTADAVRPPGACQRRFGCLSLSRSLQTQFSLTFLGVSVRLKSCPDSVYGSPHPSRRHTHRTLRLLHHGCE